VPVLSQADINARTAAILAIPVNVISFFICFGFSGLVDFLGVLKITSSLVGWPAEPRWPSYTC
jgi:hypothetical protein